MNNNKIIKQMVKPQIKKATHAGEQFTPHFVPPYSLIKKADTKSVKPTEPVKSAEPAKNKKSKPNFEKPDLSTGHFNSKGEAIKSSSASRFK